MAGRHRRAPMRSARPGETAAVVAGWGTRGGHRIATPEYPGSRCGRGWAGARGCRRGSPKSTVETATGIPSEPARAWGRPQWRLETLRPPPARPDATRAPRGRPELCTGERDDEHTGARTQAVRRTPIDVRLCAGGCEPRPLWRRELRAHHFGEGIDPRAPPAPFAASALEHGWPVRGHGAPRLKPRRPYDERNPDAVLAVCHLAPGLQRTELRGREGRGAHRLATGFPRQDSSRDPRPKALPCPRRAVRAQRGCGPH